VACRVPGEVSAFLVNGHLRAFKLVQLLSNGSLIFRSQSRPGLVGSPVVIVSLRYLDVIVEPDDL